MLFFGRTGPFLSLAYPSRIKTQHGHSLCWMPMVIIGKKTGLWACSYRYRYRVHYVRTGTIHNTVKVTAVTVTVSILLYITVKSTAVTVSITVYYR